MRNSPTAARRSLARLLRERRKEIGISRDQVAKHVGKNAATITRFEKADVRAEVGTVSMMLELYDIPRDDRPYFLDLARAARKRGWWQQYSKSIPEWFNVYVGLETEAKELYSYEIDQVPGLLQTPDYTRALVASEPTPVPEDEVQRRIDVRQARQKRLRSDPPVRLWAIINEAALRRTVGGPEVMREQMEQLLLASEEANIRLQILPFDAGAHPGSHGAFMTLKFPDPRDRDLVYVEYRMGAVYLEEDEELEAYDLTFEELKMASLSRSKSEALIRSVINELSGRKS